MRMRRDKDKTHQAERNLNLFRVSGYANIKVMLFDVPLVLVLSDAEVSNLLNLHLRESSGIL